MYSIALIILTYFYVRLAIWVTKRVSRKFAKKRAKLITGILMTLIFILIPTGDEIAGRIYFNHLCETEAEAKVYQTIELPAEYWDKDGKPKFYVNWADNLGRKYPLIYEHGEFSSLFGIENAGFEFVDKGSGSALGKVVNFRYWGGWLRRNFSPHNTADSCEVKEGIINQIFVPKNKNRGANDGNNQ